MGNVLAALAIFIIGGLVVFGIGLGLGNLAKCTQSGFDRPIFDWVHARVTDTLFTRLNGKFTQMGNNPIVEVVCTISP